MRVKNLTPLTFGVSATSLAPPQPEMVVIVRGRFDIVPGGVARLPRAASGLEALLQGPLSGDTFAPGDDERVGELIYPSDFAPLKPRAEVMFVGSCYTPRGRPLTECPVAVAVGRWRKALRVVGPRVWQGASGRASAAKSFSCLRLGWSRAWGGPAVAANPIGVGPNSEEVPNVETPREPITSRVKSYTPAGFAPQNPAWGFRATKVGSLYGASYRPRAPYLPEDFDWTHFNAAPADQHLGSTLRGNEEVVLHNLHPEHATLSTRLPGLRVRCFVHDVAKVFREVTLMLDTLLIDGDAGELLLTWRGRTLVADDELEDVTSVLVVAESLTERPDDYEKYQARLLGFEADPLALDQQLSPGELARVKAAERQKEALEASTAPLDAERREPLVTSNERHPPRELMLAPGADLRGRDLTERDLEGLDLSGADLSGAILTRARLRGAELARAKLVGAVLFEADLTDANLQAAALDRVIATKAKLVGASLRGARLDAASFLEADCRGACFDATTGTQAFFTGSDLSGASFVEAALTRADFERAVIEEAVFRHAMLSRCLFQGARGAGVSFADASLDRSSFADANLERATLRGARGARCNLIRANLADGDLRYAQLTESHFSHAKAPGARFDCADLAEARFFKAKLVSASFKQANLLSADLSKCTMHEASFEGANLYDAKLVKASGRDVVLDGANTKRAVYDAT